MDVDFNEDLSKVAHPVVKEVPKHITEFNAIGKDAEMKQITLDDYFGGE